MSARPLRLDTLGSLDVPAPSYRRQSLSPGILHVGVGNFHRAHQAVYLDELFERGLDHDWAILGAGVRPGDAVMRDALGRQDWLSTIVELEPGENRARITGSMIDFVPVDPANAALVAAMTDRRIRIVSLTVTEGGYFIDPASGVFDPDHPEIRADAARPSEPRTVFGVILAALQARRDAGHPPFTVMSCDNLPGNGHVARAAIAGTARLRDPGLASWVEEHVAFPDGMVDRITPASSDARREAFRSTFGIEDRSPVFCEPFRQWVLEDHFPTGRPALEEVGVTFTGDVAAFERMKLRILNGGHAAIAYPGALLDLAYAHEAMAHPLVAGFLGKLEREEILPVVPPVPGVDLLEYLRLVESRFANPGVADTIARLCLDGSNRQPKFILPSTRDRIAAGLPVTGLALESALWCRYLHGTTESGAPIRIEDDKAGRLHGAAQATRTDPMAFLALTEIFGDLAQAPAFRAAFTQALTALWRDGVAATLTRYLALAPGQPLWSGNARNGTCRDPRG